MRERKNKKGRICERGRIRNEEYEREKNKR